MPNSKVKAPPPSPPKDNQPAPILDLPALMAAMDINNAVTPDGLRSISGMCVVAAHERRASREFMIDMTEHMGCLWQAASYLEALCRVQRAMLAAQPGGTLEPSFDPFGFPVGPRPPLDDLIGAILQQIKALRQYMVLKLEALNEMPPVGTKLS